MQCNRLVDTSIYYKLSLPSLFLSAWKRRLSSYLFSYWHTQFYIFNNCGNISNLNLEISANLYMWLMY